MLGKSIAAATIDDLERLIRDRIPEGRHLEYKEAVPVHPQQQKAQAKAGAAERRAVDMAVAAGTGIADYGRNEILAELVAFANADGGVVVLGMSETNSAPPRADALCPIPHAAKLERRLLDQIVDQIEPRLPHASVRTISIGDDGAGVILLEAQPSVLGPHRVKATRLATIRREDACAQLSMVEIHDMVLRNARRFDEVSQRRMQARKNFVDCFTSVGYGLTQPQVKMPVVLDEWLSLQPETALVGLRVTIVPHQSLGLQRLETIRNLVPYGSIAPVGAANGHLLQFGTVHSEQQRLGGVENVLSSHERVASLSAGRGGQVEAWVIWRWDKRKRFAAPLLLTLVGRAISVFDKLRFYGGSPDLPAEIEVEIKVIPEIATQAIDSPWSATGESLKRDVVFPSMTLADRDTFNLAINQLAGDFANAIGLPADRVPQYELRYS